MPIINLLMIHITGIEFKEGDYVMIPICPKHYPKNYIKKLHFWSLGPFPILRRLGCNACLFDLHRT